MAATTEVVDDMTEGLGVSEYISLMERSEYDHVTAGTGGSNVLSSDVPEGRILIPLGVILSETSGSSNTVDLSRVEDDDTTTVIAPNINLGANETVFLNVMDDGLILPKLEGGSNLEATAGSSSVEVTLVYVHNIKE